MTPARNLSVTRRSASSAFKQASSAFALSRSVTTSCATAVTHRATATVRLSVISSLIGMTGDLRITLLETFKHRDINASGGWRSAYGDAASADNEQRASVSRWPA